MLSKLKGFKFKLFNKTKVDAANVIPEYSDNELNMLCIYNYIDTLETMSDDINTVMSFTDFYFYIKVEPNSYDEVLQFLSSFKNEFIFSKEDGIGHIIFHVTGSNIQGIFNTVYRDNIFLEIFRNSISIISDKYFKGVITNEVLNPRLVNNTDSHSEFIDGIKIQDYVELGDSSPIVILGHDTITTSAMKNIFNQIDLAILSAPPIIRISKSMNVDKSNILKFVDKYDTMIHDNISFIYIKFKSIYELIDFVLNTKTDLWYINKIIDVVSTRLYQYYNGISIYDIVTPRYDRVEFRDDEIDEIIE